MGQKKLSVWQKAVYGTGDLTINTALSGLNLIYATYFLTQVAGLRPGLAGLVPLIGRFIDAFTDPAVGRLSDRTRWKWGRRRPYFLIGAVPFGISFALLWVDLNGASQATMFLYYTGVYCVLSVAMTFLSVPYLALLPEMAINYDARTSLNTYRNIGSIFGVFAAIAIRPLAELLGGGGAGYASAGICMGVLLTLPWFGVYLVTFERADYAQRESKTSLLDSLKDVLQHRDFLHLTGMFLTGRIAMDVVGGLLILYVTYWIGRSEDFEPLMFLFLTTIVCSLPFWLWLSRRSEKSTIFMIGSVWWMTTSLLFAFAQPGWPMWVLLCTGPLVGLGYAAVDLMPWAMLGDVIDEDDVKTGERREGLYNGMFMFLRKLGGALGVFLVLGVLDWMGFQKGTQQSEAVRQTIRAFTAVLPIVCLGMGLWFARGYALTRARHNEILNILTERQGKHT